MAPLDDRKYKNEMQERGTNRRVFGLPPKVGRVQRNEKDQRNDKIISHLQICNKVATNFKFL